MLVTLLALATALACLVAAGFSWRDRAKTQDPRRRMVRTICAAGFVLVAITEACLAIWHSALPRLPENSVVCPKVARMSP